MRNRLAFFAALIVFAGCSPSPPLYRVGEQNTIDLEVRNANASSVRIDMPDMQMRPKDYPLRRTGSDTYEASNVYFGMAGTWRVSVIDDRGRRVSTFTIRVR